MSQINTLSAVENIYPDLFEQEKKVAEYILKNHKKVIDMSVSDLADSSNVSEATIMRFCKKAGFKGFYHFKISLAKDTIDPEKDFSTDIDLNNMEDSIHNIFMYKMEEIKRCSNLLDPETVKKSIAAISNCETMYLFGAGNTNPIAIFAAYQFNQCGIKTIANVTPEMQINSAFCLKENDVCLIISNSGSTNMIVDVAEIAKEKGATIIAITSYLKSPLAKLADFVLTSVTSEKIFFEAFSSTRMCHMAIIDLLLLLFSKDEKRNVYKYNSDREEYLAKYKS
ncbi:MurR/RpiR family transcriptional regulator [Sebaldella sp. S0638]|uniref:MurR/RpiR family transcriptional regulator n=1 Tax=Sebaldella sp. S0638 TaxID=2957809 RepID=UPI00209CB0AA|nr:MurR/RpiR family transcriptional regulator [Sebaldella sp. S0638]MCP1224229.1 MurR/RpiR family transcriptional regulator [Sebaldella sp. S0638]